jgi:hypothetical protein
MGPNIVSINGKDFEIQPQYNGLTWITERYSGTPLIVVEGEVTVSHGRNLINAYFRGQEKGERIGEERAKAVIRKALRVKG